MTRTLQASPNHNTAPAPTNQITALLKKTFSRVFETVLKERYTQNV